MHERQIEEHDQQGEGEQHHPDGEDGDEIGVVPQTSARRIEEEAVDEMVETKFRQVVAPHHGGAGKE